MANKVVVHVIGTGTIGEPLIGILCDYREPLGIDEVTFHKRTPLGSDRSKISHLLSRGAKLATDSDQRDAFEKLGHKVDFEAEEALARATVVIDCTPAGNDMKEKYYDHVQGPKGFIAQGSEFGFGVPYARGINDEILRPGQDRFIQVVSCNTHNITTLIKTLCDEGKGRYSLARANFVCMRRANDVSQTKDFAPAPQVGKHDDGEFGTHHAHDAYHVFETLGMKLDLFSSAVKLNTQYMHSIWFNFLFDRDITRDEMVARLKANLRVAVTDKRNCNEVFSFGRDHGYYGRILSQTVVVLPTLTVRRSRELYGFCFTPQDGNSLLSSLAAALWFIDPAPESVSKRLESVRRWLYTEI
jgi:glyceraldehyde-3-phosphate dehydrogenase (NAD(P))